MTLSADAAGHGWFADPSPGRDEEFTPGSPGSPLVALPGSPAAVKEDLLTAVLHEMGHLAGSPDGGSGLMAGSLTAGTRDLGALDQLFAQSAFMSPSYMARSYVSVTLTVSVFMVRRLRTDSSAGGKPDAEFIRIAEPGQCGLTTAA